MKVRLTVGARTGPERAIELTADPAATVADVARMLILGSPDGAPLSSVATAATVPLTLRLRYPGETTVWVLDHATPLARSGVQSGCWVQPIPEGEHHPTDQLVAQPLRMLEVLNGPQAGVRFSVIAGENRIGRDSTSRIRLHSEGVSRHHAVIDAGDTVRVRDVGSANGLRVDGIRTSTAELPDAHILRVGDTSLVCAPAPAGSASAPGVATSAEVPCVRSPRRAVAGEPVSVDLPVPPARVAPQRIPIVAVIAPVVMGAALFALTGSTMSLLFVALSPVVLVATWVDSRLSARRATRERRARFWAALGVAHTTLAAARAREVAERNRAAHGGSAIAAAIAGRTPEVWNREPRDEAFLTLRLGVGEQASDTRVQSPARGEDSDDVWSEVDAIAARFRTVAPVPVVESLGRCGSLGITGDPHVVAGLLRSIVLQLAGLHSPADLVMAHVGAAELTEWLSWLPHVDSAHSPLRAAHLAGNAQTAAALMAELERVVAERSRAEPVAPGQPAIVVLVGSAPLVERSRLVSLAEAGAGRGIHLIWTAASVDRLPAVCRTHAQVDAAGGSVTYAHTQRCIPLVSGEAVDEATVDVAVRRLAPMVDVGSRADAHGSLPTHLALHEVVASGPSARAGDAAASVVAAWAAPEAGLGAVVGVGPAGPLELDLRAHGPHALVGGTTGSGKSEFLQTWIMSLAARHSPEVLAVLLIDYKGGAAFAECTELPHSIGLVTDLTPHLVQRALTSLSAELRHREDILNAAGAKDLSALHDRGDGSAPPSLVIVVDEVAALVRDVPEFIDGLVDIAQRGRSLGVHLILATQRPAGVITDNLRANATLRVALRVADERDSVDLLGCRDAAVISPETPGRAVLAIGPAPVIQFQAAYLGGHMAAGETARLGVRELYPDRGRVWAHAHGEHGGSGPRSATTPHRRDIERMRDAIIAAARETGVATPRRAWVDPLPDTVALEDLPTDDAAGVLLGLADYPESQAQRALSLRLETVGNVAIYGAGGSGKSTVLRSIAAALSAGFVADPVQIYALDYAGGSLDSLRVLPTVGSVVGADDNERTRRLLVMLADTIDRRSALFAGCHATSLRDYRRVRGNEAEPRIVLLLDGLTQLRDAYEAEGTLVALLQRVMAAGRAVGVHVMLTSDRAGGLPTSLQATIQQRIVLRLATDAEYAIAGVVPAVLAHAQPGRARVTGGGVEAEVQIAVYGGRPGGAEEARALSALGTRLREHGVASAPPVSRMPAIIPLESLPARGNGRATFGLTADSLQPISLPTTGVCVVVGPPGSGRTTAIATALAAMARTQVLSAVRLSPGRAPSGGSAWRWSAVAEGADAVHRLAESLCARLGAGAAPDPQSTLPEWMFADVPPAKRPAPDGLPIEWPPRGATGVVVIDDIGECEGTPAEAALATLLRTARRAGLCVFVECDPATAAGAWAVHSELRTARTGIVLQPDEADGPGPLRATLPRARRRDFVPGSGFFVDAGHVTRVQVAVSSSRSCESSLSSTHRGEVEARTVGLRSGAMSVASGSVGTAIVPWVRPGIPVVERQSGPHRPARDRKQPLPVTLSAGSEKKLSRSDSTLLTSEKVMSNIESSRLKSLSSPA